MFNSTAKILENQEELKDRLAEIEALLAAEITWKKVAQEQKKIIDDLLNRFMARNFEELQVYGNGESFVSPLKPDYQPEADEENIGMVLDGET